MWPFNRKKNVMKGFSIEITAHGSKYKVFIWKNYAYDPKIIAAKFDIPSYAAACEEAHILWKEIAEARTKLFVK